MAYLCVATLKKKRNVTHFNLYWSIMAQMTRKLRVTHEANLFNKMLNVINISFEKKWQQQNFILTHVRVLVRWHL